MGFFRFGVKTFIYLIYYVLPMNKLNRWLTRKTGMWVSAIGIAIFLLNFITYSLWEIDIDILGALFFVLGMVMVIACGKSMKHHRNC